MPTRADGTRSESRVPSVRRGAPAVTPFAMSRGVNVAYGLS